jgi:hypothetical protein
MTDLMMAARTDAVGRSAARLRAAAVFFTIAVLVHNADHLRRGGDSVSAQVFWLGSLAILLEVTVVALIVTDHPLAPLVAAVTGFSLALGYVAVHFTPDRGWFSDSLLVAGTDGVSRAAAVLEATAAVALGLAGADAWRHRPGGFDAALGRRRASVGGGVGAAVRSPILAAMVLGNLVIFVGSLATR